MICDYCSIEFKIITKGSGGSNRKFCYECFPANLDRASRNNKRNELQLKRNARYKLSKGCTRCGYNRCASALEWHHPSDDKLFDPSATVIRSWDAYLTETSKCVLLCANCHREEHELLRES